jgi:hypothetical protein
MLCEGTKNGFNAAQQQDRIGWQQSKPTPTTERNYHFSNVQQKKQEQTLLGYFRHTRQWWCDYSLKVILKFSPSPNPSHLSYIYS